MTPAARTSVACDIADIQTVKFNGLVAAGEYPCAPHTPPGASRLFELDDIVALVIFSRLLKQGFKSRLAGRFACKAREIAHDHPGEQCVTFAWNMNGQVSAVPPNTDMSGGQVSGGPIMFTVTFDLRNVREFVESKLANYRLILGDE